MQFDRTGKKKPYRARGTRGGRRRKGSSRALKGQNLDLNNTQNNTDGGEMNQFGRPLRGRSEHYSNEDLRRDLSYEEAQFITSSSRLQQFQPHLHAPVQYSQVRSNNYTVPPPLELIKSCSSFSSQSTSSSHNIDCSSFENSNQIRYTQNTMGVHNFEANRKKNLQGTNVECGQTRNIITPVEDSWTSLFLISPRSHLMGMRR